MNQKDSIHCLPYNPKTVRMRAQLFQACLILCDAIDWTHQSPLVHGILQARILEWIVHGILQARILEWIAVPSTKDLPKSGTEHMSPLSCIAGGFFTHLAT